MRDYMTETRVVFNHPQQYETCKLTVARSRDNASRIHGCVLFENHGASTGSLTPGSRRWPQWLLVQRNLYKKKIVTAF